MPSSQPLAGWKPVALPRPASLAGRCVQLFPLSAEKHTADLWSAVQGHDEVWDYLSDGPYATEPDLRRAIEAKEAGTAAAFLAIIPKASGKAEGYASYMRMDPANGVIEVGNILMTPSLQKTTAATEAMYLMARHIFDDLGYRRYEWKCNALNGPSRRAALRYGFTFEGIFRQHMIIKGQNRDTAWFSMLDSEWPARKTAFEAWLDPTNFDADGHQRKSLSQIAANLP
ncbi:GNAT family N-acetyltransferase [Occallatibacter savannae]|uniref:GNAT family N-acetyltransferase n=1 Tax=Occallatibacter savannae TaxID=1002691 RepID=UPI000D69C705|nr:GNAT family protein [Occallatibacter savannae]